MLHQGFTVANLGAARSFNFIIQNQETLRTFSNKFVNDILNPLYTSCSDCTSLKRIVFPVPIFIVDSLYDDGRFSPMLNTFEWKRSLLGKSKISLWRCQ